MRNFKFKVFTIFLFLYSYSLTSQTAVKFKNTCHIFDKTFEYQETGFVALNDSIIISNYKDSCIILNLKECRIIKKLPFIIISDQLGNATYGKYSPTSSQIKENTKVWTRIKTGDDEIWFGYFSEDYSFTKKCQINSEYFVFIKKYNKFYACVKDGFFINNGSTIKTQFNSGIISFDENGYLLNAKKVTNILNRNGGEQNTPMISPILNYDEKNIYLGTLVNNNGTIQEISNYIYFGDEKINCAIGGNVNYPFIILQMDTSFNLESKFIFEGSANSLYIDDDSIYIFGSEGNLFTKETGVMTSPINKYFHYRLVLSKSDLKFSSICNLTGSGGSGGHFNPFYFPAQYYQDENYFSYLTFKGTIYLDKIYTSGGGQNFIIGYQNDKKKCIDDLNKIVFVNSQSNIWANFTNTESYQLISVSKSADFWINDIRINNGDGIYYWGINKDGIVDFSKLGFTNSTISTSNVYYNKLLPNPSNGILKWIGNDIVNSAFIFDNSGRLILLKKIDNPDNINLSELSSGVYFIKLDNGYFNKIVIN
jgi:hypothetical protein